MKKNFFSLKALVVFLQKVSFCKNLMKNNRLFSACRQKKIAFAVTPLVCIFLFLINCAFLNPRNRPLTSYLDEKSMEINKSNISRIGLAPIVIPVGTVTLFSDILVIHPISTIVPASRDAYEYIWKDPSGSIIRETFLFIPKVIFTPPFIIIDMVIRSIFDIGSR